MVPPAQPAYTVQGPPTPEGALARRAFLANLRHELRTPINAIMGYSEMLIEDTRVDTHPAHTLCTDVENILAAGQQLLSLVNDTLDQSKIEAGQLDMSLEDFGAHLRHQLRTPVTAVMGYSEMLIEDAPAVDGADLIPDLHKIHAAAQRFLNLIDDVVNYARIQSGEIAADAQSAQTSSMIEEVVSTIQILKQEADHAASGGHILVVDDNEINRDIIRLYLQRMDHSASLAENGRAALEMLQAQKFDLVLLDIMMPEMNGYQVLQHIKNDGALRDIPVIMISALDEVDSVVRCIEMGAADYLPKPFNPVLLHARIDACLEQKRLRDKEVEYLRHVALVTAAAAALEAEQFQPDTLNDVITRGDELGQLARVFRRMAVEVYAREQRLKQQVQQLRIQIDETKKARQVAEITESDYFQQLQQRAKNLRNRGA